MTRDLKKKYVKSCYSFFTKFENQMRLHSRLKINTLLYVADMTVFTFIPTSTCILMKTLY